MGTHLASYTRVAGSSPNVDIDAMCIWIRHSNVYGSRVKIAQLKKDNHTSTCDYKYIKRILSKRSCSMILIHLVHRD